MSLPSKSFQVPVRGGDLHVVLYGDGVGDPVMLIHGITSSNRAFQIFADSLIARGKAPYAVDLRGRGLSRDLPGPYGMRQHAEDVAAAITILNLIKPDVIGHSMGGFIVAVLYKLFPNLVGDVVFADGGIPLPLPPGVTIEQAMAAILGPALDRLSMTFKSKEEYREFLKSKPSYIKGWTSVHDEYADYDLKGAAPYFQPATSREAVAEDSKDTFDSATIVADGLKALAKESLFLRAPRGLQNEEGGLYPKAVLDNFLPLYPNLKLVELEDVNHYDMFLGDGAEQVAQVIYGARK